MLSEDLTRLRRAMEELAPLAEQHSGWKPAMLYALAAQHRICRAYSQALTQIESALELAPIGEHQLWQNIAHVHVLALLDTHQHERARTCADAYLASARSQLGIAPEELQLACAWAHAACGLDDAAALADDARARLIAGGVTGLRVGYAHEIQARIALLAGDSDAYTGLLASCTKLYRAYKSPALTAKLQRLIQSGERSDAGDSRASTPSLIEAVGRCGNAELRAQLTLQLLARITGAHGGFLFGAIGAELSCQATLGDLELDASLLGRVDAYLQLFMRSDVTTVTGAITVREAATVSSWTDVHGESYQPVLLRHFSEGRIVLTGLALLTVVDGVTFKPPLQLASELSRQLTRIGDSSIASRSLD